MRLASLTGAMTILLALQIFQAAAPRPGAEMARLKKDLDAAREELNRGQEGPATEAQKAGRREHYYKNQILALARRAMALANAYPDSPEAPEALVWIADGLGGGCNPEFLAQKSAAYDLLAERYLDSEKLLPLCRIAWWNPIETPSSEAFLRAASERSHNLTIRAVSSFSLGRHYQQLANLMRLLDDADRSKILLGQYGAEAIERMRALKPEKLKAAATLSFEKILNEYADFPRLAKQAEGELFRLRNLDVGCRVPEIDGQDIDGKPMKLSQFRGKVVMLSFWATWCGPCMGLVPHEKELVERMKGRPFVLVGVNGDDNRDKAQEVSAKEGLNWRSFWDGGRGEGTTPVKWAISSWPTVYLIDAEGVIRPECRLNPHELDKAVQALVAEAEAAAKNPHEK